MKIIILFTTILFWHSTKCQNIDTIYYDVNNKGVEHTSFASIKRIIYTPKDPYFPAKYRDYDMQTQNVLADGYILNNDKYDATKSTLDGICTLYYSNGKIKAKYNYDHGELNGLQQEYYENGEIRTEGYMINGICNGELKVYHENGNLMYEYTLMNGENSGPTKMYDENGVIISSINTKNGIRDGEVINYQNGLPKYIYTYRNGLRHGQQICLNTSGIPISITNYDNDIPIGSYEYRDNGQSVRGIFKTSIENHSNTSLRISCACVLDDLPIKDKRGLLSEIAGKISTSTKNIKTVRFDLFIKNNINTNIKCNIEDVKIIFFYKKTHSKNLALAEDNVAYLYEKSANYIANKAYSNAAYIARSAATQSVTNSSTNISNNMVNITENKDEKSSSQASAIGTAISGLIGVDNTGNATAAVSGNITTANGQSSTKTQSNISGKITQLSNSYNNTRTTYIDGYIQRQIYNEEYQKAKSIETNVNNKLVELIDLARHTNFTLPSQGVANKHLLGMTAKRFDRVRLSFYINGEQYNFEFNSDDIDNRLQ